MPSDIDAWRQQLAADLGDSDDDENSAHLAGEFMLNALRLVEGVPRARFAEATGLDDVAIASTVDALVGKGLLRNDPARLGTTPLGLAFLDDVVGAFFAD